MTDDGDSKKPEDIIESCTGAFGRWQITMVFLISLTRLPLSWHQMGIVFLAPKTEFHCSNNTMSQCAEECPSHVFDTSEFKTSIITEWDLVCENSYADVIQVLIMAGNLAGSLVFGFISDKFGRKQPLMLIIILEVVAGVGASFSPWLWLFLVLKVLSTMAVGGIHIISFVLMMEMIGKSYRTSVGAISQIPFSMGSAFLGVIGYLIRDWRYIQLAISIPSAIFVLYYWIIPESARWLLTVGRTEESVKIMTRAAKYNRLPTFNINDKVLVHLEEVKFEQKQTGSLLDLIRTFEMRIITICTSLSLFFIFIVFYGATQYLGQNAENPYSNLGLSGLLEIPGAFICIYVMNRYGRKRTTIIVSFLGGVCVLLIITVPSDSAWGVTILGAMGIMFVGSSIKMFMIYLGELYPTIIRTIGFGVSMTCGKLGSTVSSLIVGLSTVEPWLPPLVFGISAGLVSVCCLWLPETLNQKLPDTVEEALEIRRRNKVTPKSNICD